MESGICWFEASFFPDFALLHPGYLLKTAQPLVREDIIISGSNGK